MIRKSISLEKNINKMETVDGIIKKEIEKQILSMYMDVIHNKGIKLEKNYVQIFTPTNVTWKHYSEKELLLRLLFTKDAHEFNRDYFNFESFDNLNDIFFLWVYFKVFGPDKNKLDKNIKLIFLIDPIMKYLMSDYETEDETIDLEYEDDFNVYPIINGKKEDQTITIFEFLDKYDNVKKDIIDDFLDRVEEDITYEEYLELNA